MSSALRGHGGLGLCDVGLCDLIDFEVSRAMIVIVSTLVESIKEDINDLIARRTTTNVRVRRLRSKDVTCCDMVGY